MKPIGKAIYDILSSDAAVSAIVSTRIFPVQGVQEGARPYLVYVVESTTPNNYKDGVAPINIFSFDVSCFADTYAEVDDLGIKVVAALDHFKGTNNSIIIDQCLFEGALDLIEYGSEHDGVFIKQITFKMRVVNA